MGRAARNGRRLYDWWSRHPGLLRLLYAIVFLGRNRRLRRASVEALALEPGHRVLELGCGAGNSFAELREAVGETGQVVGVDYSGGMTSQAADRIHRAGWRNVHVVRGDAARLGLRAESFDAAYLAMSLSAMPDVEAVLAEADECLRDGGRLVVLDARPFQHWPWRMLNPVVVPLATRLTNWFPALDIPGALRRQFPAVSVRNWHGGSVYIAKARTGPSESEESGSPG